MLKYEDRKIYLYNYSNDELICHVMRAKENSEDSLRLLMEIFENYILRLSQKYTKDKYLIDDLVQEGKIALIYAIKKFDYSKSNNFKYYAIMWIKQAINRYYEKIVDDISIPIRKKQIIKKIKKLIRINKEYNSDYDYEDNFPKNILNFEYKYISLEDENSINDDLTRKNHEKFSCEREKDPYQRENESYIIEKLYLSLNKLNYKEKIIIYYRFGINNFPELTLKEISRIFNVSSEAIRKMEKKALLKLKSELKGYIDGF